MPDKHEVLGLGGKFEIGQGAQLLRVHAGLALEGKRFEGPRLRQSGLLDPPSQRRLGPMMVLRSEESREEGTVRQLVRVGMRQLVVDDRGDFS